MPLTEQEQQRVREAIETAEKATSGEIRVCVENRCKEDVLDRAANYFAKLNMHQTALRNGVLIYIALDDHKFAIIGDSGINKAVPENFWESTKETMLQHFRRGNLAEGICAGIMLAGEQLKELFPYQDDDKDELSNDIVFMKGD